MYSPYECAGSFGKGHNLDEFAHGSFFWWKGQFYHVWCYYLKNGFKFRETIISYCHIDDKGEIVTDIAFLDKHFINGVGQYKSSWEKIEAEWYYEISSNIKKEGTRATGFKLTNIKNGSWVKYANVDFESNNLKFEAVLESIKGEGTIEIRTDSIHGPILGQVSVKSKKR